MTHRFIARDGLPLNPCPKLRNEPKAFNPGVPSAYVPDLPECRRGGHSRTDARVDGSSHRIPP
jgi:hypothetical protein